MHDHYFSILNVMTPFPHSIGLDATLLEARAFMKEHNIRHLPVTKEGELHGIITEHDIKLMLSPEFGYPDPKELMVFDVYVPEPYIVDISTSLSSVTSTLVERKIGSAIITKHGKLVGILTTRDVCRALAKFLTDRENPEDGEVA
ncbi:MAG: CBS domain-containing protein [Gammaproteobacteria bacterium]